MNELEHEVLRLQNLIRRLEQDTSNRSENPQLDTGSEQESCHDPASESITGEAFHDLTYPGQNALAVGVGTSSSAAKEIGTTVWRTFGPEKASSGPMGVYSFPISNNLTLPEHAGHALDLDAEIHAVLTAIKSDLALQTELVANFAERANRYQRFFDDQALLDTQFFPHEPLHLQLLHSAILATGATLSTNLEVQQMGIRLADFAQSIAIHASIQHPCIETLQALITLSWLQIMSCKDLQAWIYNSIAAGLASHLGLHVLSPSDPSSQEGEDLTHKVLARTFWTYCFVDRMASAALGRLPTVQWRHVQTPRYRRIFNDETIKHEDLYFDHICELWRLFDQNMDEVYNPTFRDSSAIAKDEMLRKAQTSLAEFYAQADERLRSQSYTSKEHPTVYFFRIAYETALILLNRPFLIESSNERFRMVLQAMATAASSVSSIVQRYRRDRSFADAPTSMIFHLTRSSIVFLLLATSTAESVRRKAACRLKHCLEALGEYEATWRRRSTKSIRLIQELAARWKVVRALPLRFSNPLSDVYDAFQLPEVGRRDLLDVQGSYSGLSEQSSAHDAHNLPVLDWPDVQTADFSWLTNDGYGEFENALLELDPALRQSF